MQQTESGLLSVSNVNREGTNEQTNDAYEALSKR